LVGSSSSVNRDFEDELIEYFGQKITGSNLWQI